MKLSSARPAASAARCRGSGTSTARRRTAPTQPVGERHLGIEPRPPLADLPHVEVRPGFTRAHLGPQCVELLIAAHDLSSKRHEVLKSIARRSRHGVDNAIGHVRRTAEPVQVVEADARHERCNGQSPAGGEVPTPDGETRVLGCGLWGQHRADHASLVDRPPNLSPTDSVVIEHGRPVCVLAGFRTLELRCADPGDEYMSGSRELQVVDRSAAENGIPGTALINPREPICQRTARIEVIGGRERPLLARRIELSAVRKCPRDGEGLKARTRSSGNLNIDRCLQFWYRPCHGRQHSNLFGQHHRSVTIELSQHARQITRGPVLTGCVLPGEERCSKRLGRSPAARSGE